MVKFLYAASALPISTFVTIDLSKAVVASMKDGEICLGQTVRSYCQGDFVGYVVYEDAKKPAIHLVEGIQPATLN